MNNRDYIFKIKIKIAENFESIINDLDIDFEDLPLILKNWFIFNKWKGLSQQNDEILWSVEKEIMQLR